MKIEFAKENSKLTVSVVGKVDTTTAPELEKAVFDHLDGVTELVLDLSEMPYTSSAGLRTDTASTVVLTFSSMTSTGFFHTDSRTSALPSS